MISVALAADAPAAAPTTAPTTRPIGKVYVVGYAHLDTQWRWTFPQVIEQFLRNTMEKNFELFQKYPDYIFNFTGANRYMFMQEAYPEDFAKLKKYVAEGKWFPAGASLEEGDVNSPSGESIIRHVLYGNEYFRKEFGKASTEFMVPDSFGFQASLPSLLAHCGLNGFSTQKLTWGSAVGIPFNVGVWEGPDGRGVVAALNPGNYAAPLRGDLSNSKEWIDRVEEDGKKSGVYVDYHYYGTGDIGGAPGESSAQWLEKSVHGDGPLKVISATSDQMFNELTPQQIAKLPKYKGDLLLTNHSAGSLTSEAYMKRWNRKNEQLADAAERISTMADYFHAMPYPMRQLTDAWRLFLSAQFHDSMAGTALPKAFNFSWNDEVLAMNQFASAEQNAVGGMASAMDTQGPGVAVVVYNPLSIARQDVAEASVTIPNSDGKPISVIGPDGNVVPSQILSRSGDHVHLLFLASMPPVGLASYDVRLGAPTSSSDELSITDHSLENAHYRVVINKDGDIASIYDKVDHREVLASPARLEFHFEKPRQYPAWNMDWDDRQKPPYAYVSGPAKIKITEDGPVRVALRTERRAQGSKFIQRIRLSAGSAGDVVEIASTIDWQTRKSSLKASFPLTAGNPLASYESQSAAVERGNNDAKKFEVPQQMWFDLTDSSGKFGTAILNDCKYGSDKPDDHTVRLTLLYTPGVKDCFQDQATQDLGRHEMVYEIADHAGDWQQGNVPWLAARLNQPLRAFVTASHPGALGREFSMLQVSNDHVTVMAMKEAESGDGIIVRLHELDGQKADDVHVKFASPIEQAREVDGQECDLGPAHIEDGQLVVNMTPFILRAFKLNLSSPANGLSEPISQPVPIAYNADVISSRANPGDGSFDSNGNTFPAEAMPETINSGGIRFMLGPVSDEQNNVVACCGQSISLPSEFQRLYILAAAADGDTPAIFKIGDRTFHRTIQNWTGYIGQWDNRLWGGIVPKTAYCWRYPLIGLVPGFIKRDTVAWYCDYRHNPQQGNQYYRYAYLF
ncbi:MAG TPA: glycoside hydrolase family 38 C-terminal domain-containing protein, partial [Tepidisphaeraceae bacterium]|nr:glycoside hydrolase family 38 C-terminal domain-containing protein [Tepidisphaeraceae bacterium]